MSVSSKIMTSSTQKTARARAMLPARYVLASWDFALAIMEPGSAIERVDLRGAEGLKTALGFDVDADESWVLDEPLDLLWEGWASELRFRFLILC